MPPATLEALERLANGGATVVFEGGRPDDVPGWGALEGRRAALRRQRAEAARIGDVEGALTAAGVARETVADQPGLEFERRAFDGGHHYFLANRGKQTIEGWVRLAKAGRSAVILDPMSGRSGVAAQRGSEVWLRLEAGESLIVRTFTNRAVSGPRWTWWDLTNESQALEGTWQVRFIAGGPELPAPYETRKLASWTQSGGERFGGTASYSLAFDAPARRRGAAWFLELGEVRDSARVRLNGKELGVVFAAPWRVRLDGLTPRDNRLEIEVTNVAANRVRDLDRRKVIWHAFHDIDFANIDYKPFDASGWPVREAGLLGPVALRAGVESGHGGTAR
jgi:hypothetical protein